MDKNIYNIIPHYNLPEVKQINKLIVQRKDDLGFGKLYMNRVNDMHEFHMKKLGRWGFCENNKSTGILTPKTKSWDDLNRMNTHPGICKYLVGEAITSNPNIFEDFGKIQTNQKNVEKLISFLHHNYDLYFTKKITDVYFNHIYSLLNHSWASGNITMVLVLTNIKKIFPDIVEMTYGFRTGDKNDMVNGIDLSIELDTGKINNFQIKSGSFTDRNYGGFYYVEGSPNKLTYKDCNYFIYGGLPYGKRTTSSIIVFKNEKIKKKDGSNTLLVPCNQIFYKKQENMPIPEMLHEILTIVSKNDISFTIQKESSTNYFELVEQTDEYDKIEKVLILNLADPNDEHLEELVKNKLDELSNLFK